MFDAGDLARENCIACEAPGIRPSIVLSQEGIAPGKPDHQITYGHVVICCCARCGSGFVEVRKHDCFDFEEVFDQNEWFAFDALSGRQLAAALAGCPAPIDVACTCPVHRSLRETVLPAFPWTYGFEGAAHVHPIAIDVHDGLPLLVLPRT